LGWGWGVGVWDSGVAAEVLAAEGGGAVWRGQGAARECWDGSRGLLPIPTPT
jgi:hypothetical protein